VGGVEKGYVYGSAQSAVRKGKRAKVEVDEKNRDLSQNHASRNEVRVLGGVKVPYRDPWVSLKVLEQRERFHVFVRSPSIFCRLYP
jgi:hypothetical protein